MKFGELPEELKVLAIRDLGKMARNTEYFHVHIKFTCTCGHICYYNGYKPQNENYFLLPTKPICCKCLKELVGGKTEQAGEDEYKNFRMSKM